ncbi:tyrosine-type recombinase/integrase [Tsukamurella paurometabola]|uniref:Site-specific tyrosine recombinase XerC n=1 Tax=Tsukamurella paurometabola TaxID=2061 RepID=A0A3P8KIA8_TSUPA|nr:site-specific integrase [Tsukamurella paurometabola]UEA82956.1 tyrosine-type recombinase/integrase [Tsukamurella paurometabola]VDR40038.1 site-specific tyrosine recombinase XerC [Tsukamurella paurometabola]
MSKRKFGSIRKLPSGRFQARYTAPDGEEYKADDTFPTEAAADDWLVIQRAKVLTTEWVPRASADSVAFRAYSESWLKHRTLKPKTREHYEQLLRLHINPTFGDRPLKAITPDAVRAWHATLAPGKATTRAHSYSLLRTIMLTAVKDDVIDKSPCRITAAGSTKRRITIKPASIPELSAIAAAMPDRLRLIVLLASWCALRFGELAELRRRDVELHTTKDEDGNDVHSGVLRIRRGVVYVDKRHIVGDPKAGSRRDVAIPPGLVPVVRAHLEDHVAPDKDGLLFPAARDATEYLTPTTLYKSFHPARDAAGRPDLRFHDLRHSGAVLAAQSGATLAELMGRLGHSTPAAALRYQSVAAGRDAEIARRLSALIEGEKS